MTLHFEDMQARVVEHALLPGLMLVSVVEHAMLPGPRRWCSTGRRRSCKRGGYVNAGGAFALPRMTPQPDSEVIVKAHFLNVKMAMGNDDSLVTAP